MTCIPTMPCYEYTYFWCTKDALYSICQLSVISDKISYECQMHITISGKCIPQNSDKCMRPYGNQSTHNSAISQLVPMTNYS